MTKSKVIAYSNEQADCPRFNKIFADFEIIRSDSQKDFFEKINSLPADAAVICFCSCGEKDAEKLPLMNALTGPIPLFACSKSPDSDFIFHSGQAGIEGFLVCDSNIEEIRERVQHAIRRGGLKRHLESRYPGCLASSIYVHKMIDLIVQKFPQRLKEKDVAESLDISMQWLESLIVKGFGMNYSRFIRRIWVYQALLMMNNTMLSNSEIAEELYWTEETNMGRDFNKELHISPGKARKLLLSGMGPEEFLK